MDYEARHIVSVSPEQERLWLLSHLAPDVPLFNFGRILALPGPVDRLRCERALYRVAERHEPLRTYFTMCDDTLAGVIHTSVILNVRYTDLTRIPAEGREPCLRRIAQKDLKRVFTLNQPPLWRARLIRVSDDDWRLVYIFHQMIFDSQSATNLDNELGKLFAAETIDDTVLPLPTTTHTQETAAWRSQFNSGQFAPQRQYWLSELKDASEDIGLPTDRPRPARSSHRGREYLLPLPLSLSPAIELLAQHHDTEPFTILLTGFIALLHRYTNRSDIMVGTALSRRDRNRAMNLIGAFSGTAVIRTDLHDDPIFSEVVCRVRRSLRHAVENQEMSFASVVGAVVSDRDLSRPPLYHLGFNNIPRSASEVVPAATVDLDLNVDIVMSADSTYHARIQYAIDLFDDETIRRFGATYCELLTSATANPATAISALHLIPPEENQLLDSWSGPTVDYPHQTLHDAIFEQAAISRHAPAAGYGGRWLSYEELTAHACQIARWLRLSGVEPGSIVAVCLTRGPSLLPTLLGILAAGGAYLPLEPQHPSIHLDGMINDAGARHLVTISPLAHLLTVPRTTTVLCVDTAREAIAAQKKTPPPVEVGPEDPAYVMFTSESAGNAKGTTITHRAILNRLLWMRDQFGLGNADRVLHKTPYVFDVSVLELFWPLLSGAGVVIAAPGGHHDSEYLAQLINRERVTVAHFVPSLLESFLEYPELIGLDRVICSGEVLSPRLAMRCFERLPGVRLYNFYGPTETTIDVSWHACIPGEPRVPIGRPLANTRLEVLDQSLRRVPIGAIGELCVLGVQVADGYIGQPEATERRFVPDPHGSPNTMLYRTGDLARWRHDGQIDFIGRQDDQVKVRGVRVELAEIRSVLERHLNVERAVIAFREDTPDGPGLVAYVRWTGDPDALSDALRNHAISWLPQSIIPSTFVNVSQFPVLSNGKLDRARLPAPSSAPMPISEHTTPRTPIELILHGIWSDLLGRPDIGVTDDFFSLGGDSLLAFQLVSQIARIFHVTLALHRCFELHTIADYALAILDLQLQRTPHEAGGQVSKHQQGKLII